jgi:hypothetical protein
MLITFVFVFELEILVGKPERKIQLVRPKRRWEDTIGIG